MTDKLIEKHRDEALVKINRRILNQEIFMSENQEAYENNLIDNEDLKRLSTIKYNQSN